MGGGAKQPSTSSQAIVKGVQSADQTSGRRAIYIQRPAGEGYSLHLQSVCKPCFPPPPNPGPCYKSPGEEVACITHSPSLLPFDRIYLYTWLLIRILQSERPVDSSSACSLLPLANLDTGGGGGATSRNQGRGGVKARLRRSPAVPRLLLLPPTDFLRKESDPHVALPQLRPMSEVTRNSRAGDCRQQPFTLE